NELNRIALVIDARSGVFFEEATSALENVRRDVSNYRMVFLEASDDALVRRFDASRRLHPLATDDNLQVGISRERELMSAFRDGADLILDTSDLSVRELRAKIGAYFEGGTPGEGLKTTIISFGYKFGLPLDADIVLDVRFLPNPHWIEELRPHTGLDEPVRDYVLGHDQTTEFLARSRDLFAVLLPGYQSEGRHYLTVGIGCTGGRHRSVVLAQELCALIEERGFRVKTIHRDVERPPVVP
ncbi:MAG TPA: RNase adapter RapZ, partial [Actinomycetota bacterium]|nr:RNase adapter RapZ [Actinomycetota bacterium]